MNWIDYSKNTLKTWIEAIFSSEPLWEILLNHKELYQHYYFASCWFIAMILREPIDS
jgi:hypothetical protein